MEELKINIKGEILDGRSVAVISNVVENIGLKGFLENVGNEIKLNLQGSRECLEEFLAWVQKGSFMKTLIGLSYDYIEAKTIYNKFEVRNQNLLTRAAKSIREFTYKVIDFSKINLRFEKVPNHIVIIPDGNRRWAREKNWHPWIGHLQITKNRGKLVDMFEAAERMGVEYITFWAFSTENWKREEKEIDILMNMMRDFTDELISEGKKRNIRFRHIGRKDRLPKDVLDRIENLEKETSKHNGLNIQFAVDYGGKDEIIRGINSLLKKDIEEANEEVFTSFLDTGRFPPPDLIIRTGGEKRTSGAFMWHSDYAELYFTNIMFPDFDANSLIDAVRDYSFRVRRFGGTAKEDLKNIKQDKLTDDKK